MIDNAPRPQAKHVHPHRLLIRALIGQELREQRGGNKACWEASGQCSNDAAGMAEARYGEWPAALGGVDRERGDPIKVVEGEAQRDTRDERCATHMRWRVRRGEFGCSLSGPACELGGGPTRGQQVRVICQHFDQARRSGAQMPLSVAAE